MMFVVPSTLQVLLAIVLVLLGVCGNLVMPFVSYRTTLRCPHITVLAALDFTATLLGPGLMLVTIVTGPAWLEHNKSLCHTLSFLNSWLLITCFLVLFILAVFCPKVQHNVLPYKRRRGRRRELFFLAVCLSTGLLLGVLPLLGWSSYHGFSFLYSCSLTKHFQPISKYSLLYLVSSFLALSVTIVLVFRARNHHRLYPLQILWERHEFETKTNDPELTTIDSSNASSCYSFRVQSRIQSRNQSRKSSDLSRSGTILSFNNTESPTMSKKSSQPSRLLDNTLLEIALRNTRRDVDATKGVAEARSPSPVNLDRRDSQPSSPSVQLSILTSSASMPRDAFVTSSMIPHNFPVPLRVREIFQSPRFLPQFTGLQQQRSLSRLLSLRCCVTLLCWLPLYVTVVLQLAHFHYPQELHVLIQWLIFIPSSISPLLSLCDASYRRALKRAAHSIFKACARRNETHADLSKSHDVELKIEGTEQVKLRDVMLKKL